MEFCDIKTQYRRYEAEIDARMKAVMNHGRFIMGPEIEELEGRLEHFVNVRHCVTVASGTMSLEIALRALAIGPGDEVITVPFTWVSTAESIALVGAKPVFVDIEPATFNINIALIEPAITSKTKAIMPVSLFGQMPDYSSINQIAAAYNLAVIEDGAQSFGATQNGRRSCGLTLVGSTSFFPAKPLGCYGDGGALFTDDDELADKMRAIRTHGGIKRHHHTLVGTNGRFDTLQAAVVLAKLSGFEWEVSERNRIGACYSELLRDKCTIPEVQSGNSHVYAQYTIRVKNRDEVAARLRIDGIPSAVYYPKCLHQQPAFSDPGLTQREFPEAEKVAREVLSLPMHAFLKASDQEQIVRALTTIVGLGDLD